MTYLLARLEAQTICKSSFWFIHFVLNKLTNWKGGVFMFTLQVQEFNSGEANSVCRSLHIDSFAVPEHIL